MFDCEIDGPLCCVRIMTMTFARVDERTKKLLYLKRRYGNDQYCSYVKAVNRVTS